MNILRGEKGRIRREEGGDGALQSGGRSAVWFGGRGFRPLPPPFPPLFVSVTLPLVSALHLSYTHLTQGGMAECKPGAHDLS